MTHSYLFWETNRLCPCTKSTLGKNSAGLLLPYARTCPRTKAQTIFFLCCFCACKIYVFLIIFIVTMKFLKHLVCSNNPLPQRSHIRSWKVVFYFIFEYAKLPKTINPTHSKQIPICIAIALWGFKQIVWKLLGISCVHTITVLSAISLSVMHTLKEIKSFTHTPKKFY